MKVALKCHIFACDQIQYIGNISFIKVEKHHKELRLYSLSQSENTFQNWRNDYSIRQMAHIDKAVYMFGLLYFVFSF